MKKIFDKNIILFFIIGLGLIVLFYFLLSCDQRKNKPVQKNNDQIKFLAPPTTTFKGPDSPPHAKGPTGPPPSF